MIARAVWLPFPIHPICRRIIFSAMRYGPFTMQLPAGIPPGHSRGVPGAGNVPARQKMRTTSRWEPNMGGLALNDRRKSVR